MTSRDPQARPDGPTPLEIESPEPFVQEFLRLRDEGWEPDPDEFVARIPDEVRDDARARIEEALDGDATPAESEGDQPAAGTVEAAFAPRAWGEIEEAFARTGASDDDGPPADDEELLIEVDDDAEAGDEPGPSAVSLFSDAPPAPSIVPVAETGEAEAAEPEPEPRPVVRSAAEELAHALQAPPAEEQEEHDPSAEAEPEGDACAVEEASDGEPSAQTAVADEPAATASVLDELLPDDGPTDEPTGDAGMPAEPTAAEDAPVTAPTALVGSPEVPGYACGAHLADGPRGPTWTAVREEDGARVVLRVFDGELDRRQLDAAQAASERGGGSLLACVPLVDHGVLVRDHVDGRPLDEACADLTAPEKARLLMRLALALTVVGDEGAGPLLLQPSNVLVTDRGEVRVVDLGLPYPPERLRQSLFAAPEQVKTGRGGREAGVYGFGSLMYLLLAGRMPHHREELIPEEDPELPRTVDARVPEGLQAICMACLARNPRARPSMLRVADELERFLSGAEVLLRPAIYRDRVRRQAKEHRARLDEWAAAGTVSREDADRMHRFYRRVIGYEENWTHDERRIDASLTALRSAGALLLAGAWLAAWTTRSRPHEWFAWAVPLFATVVLLGSGAWALRRRETQAGIALLAGGALAVVPAVVAALSAFGVLAGLLPDARPLLPGAPFENLQLCAGALAGLLLAGGMWAGLRRPVFAWLVAGLGAAALLLGAWTGGLFDGARWEGWLVPAPLVLAIAIGVACERARRPRWGTPFHVLGLAALVALPAAAACAGLMGTVLVADWILAGPAALAGHAVVLLAVREVLARRRSLDLRRHATVLGWVAPFLLLAATAWNAWSLAHPGAIGVHVVLSGVLLAWATARRQRPALLQGLLGLAAGCALLFARASLDPVFVALGVAFAGAALAVVPLARRSTG